MLRVLFLIESESCRIRKTGGCFHSNGEAAMFGAPCTAGSGFCDDLIRRIDRSIHNSVNIIIGREK